MRRTKRFLGLAALLVPLLCAGARAQNTFEGEVDTVIVEVPVHVLDDGEPVRGLTAADFEVFDGRKKQEIVGFEVVDLSTSPREEGSAIQSVPLAARRHFLLLFDVSFSDPVSVTRARHAAVELVESSLHPTDLVGVATYSIMQGPRLVLGFTPDREQVKAAIDTLGISQVADSLTDPLALLIREPGSSSAVTGAGQTSGRTNFNADLMFQEQVKDLVVATDRATQDQARNQLLAMARGMEGLARTLGNVEGRKHVVLLSEGVDSTSILGTPDSDRATEMARAVETGEHWRVNSDERYGNTSSLNFLQTMLEEFRRADAVIQAVDISNLRGGSISNQNTLFIMADETGGELIRNFNDPAKAMETVLDHTSVTYLLAFQPEDLKADGEYHELRVKLTGGPRGADVIHRPGYYAPRPFEQKNELERRFEAADEILSGREAGAITSSVLATPFWFQQEKAYVPLLVEVDGPSILAGRQDDEVVGIEIYAYAIASSGTVQDFISQRLGLEIGKVRPVFEQSGLKFFGSMDLPPGQYELRTLVRETDSGRSSTRSFALTVPERTGSPYLMTPLVPETPGKWLMIREQGNDDQARGIPYPFMQGEQAFIPAARPAFSEGRPAQLVLKGRNLGASGQLTAKVMTSDGQTIEGPSVELVQNGDDTMVATFDPKGLKKGSYVLVVEVSSGGSTARTTLAFDVVG